MWIELGRPYFWLSLGKYRCRSGSGNYEIEPWSMKILVMEKRW
jgi:hypothetical protein